MNQPKSPAQTRQNFASSHGLSPLNGEDYSLYAEYAMDILSRHTLDGVFLYVSPSCKTQFHCEPEELIGRRFDEFVHPYDLELFHRSIEEMRHISGEMAISFRGLRKDGTILWLETIGKVASPEQTGGEPEIIAVTRNITDRKLAELEIVRSEEKYRTLLESIPQRVFFKNKDSVFLAVNTAFASDCNLSPKDFIDKTDFDFYPRELAEKYREDDLRVMETGITEEMDESYKYDGVVKTIHTLKSPVRDEEGRIIGILGVLWDITERKKAEEARALLAAIVESSDNAIISSTLDGCIVSWNRGAEQLTGYLREDAVGNHVSDLVPIDQADELPQILEKLKRGERIERMESIWKGKSGEPKIVSLTISPVKDSQGNIIGASTIAHDITELKRAKEKIERYALELERANEEVKQFAYIVSHDLRAPLINLKGFAAELRSALEVLDMAFLKAMPHLDEDLCRAAQESLKVDIPESLDYIDSSASRMDYFVNAVLGLSRLGRREMIFEPLDLESIVNSVLKGIAHQIEEKHVKITVNPLPEIVGDRTSIEQIAANILTNAVLYLDKNRPGEIEVGGEKRDDETVFYVRDNGSGIAEEDMSKVFAPFRRAGRSDVKGEGLGMAYAQTLAYRHGGYIRCKSKLGVGTTFTVTVSNHLE